MVGEERTAGGKRRPWRMIAAGLVVLLLAGGGAAWYGGLFARHGAEEHVGDEKYTCGMHPWIITDKPGDCPICAMKLTRIEKQPDAAKPGATAAAPRDEDFFADIDPKSAGKTGGKRTILFYRNPMNPMVTSPTPAKDDMGMDYVPVYEDEAVPPGTRGPVEGLATVRVAEDVLVRSGVQTAPAVRAAAGRTIRTVGIVVPDERRVRSVQTKVEGWVERLHVNFTGQYVAAGQPLASIYAPELLSTQEEYLRAKRTAEQFLSSPDPQVRSIGEDLVRSARRRLELYDVPASFVDGLEKKGTPQKSVTLSAPFAGYVTVKEVTEGQKVEPGMALFTLTDLSQVWIEASLYEYEAGAVSVGKEATLSVSGQPGLALAGKVTFVSPVLSPESRTLTVRFEFPNPGLVLKPQMYVNVSLALAASTGVVVPESALMDTGVRTVVFVETAPGTFEPRAVSVGVRGDGTAEILAGVREGEMVAVKANFLLDSESRLRAAIERMTTGKEGAK